MANRNTLHKSQLPAFKEWLSQTGWELLLPKGDWEAVRAKKGNRLLLVYDRIAGDHLTVDDIFTGVVRAFINSRRERE